jgi:hypothetical protein
VKKLLIVCSLVVVLIGVMAFGAVATQITGAISFSGTDTQSNTDLSVATAFTSFTNVVVSTTGGTGTYLPALLGQAVTFNPFTFRPSLFPSPVVPLWTFDFGGKTYSFDATGVSVDFSNQNTITMEGTGTAHATGFDSTPGQWFFSANNALGTSSFSVSTEASAVPEPTSLLLFGLGLVGLAGVRKFKQ